MCQACYDAVDLRLRMGHSCCTIPYRDVVAVETCDLGMAWYKNAMMEQAHIHKEPIEKDGDFSRGHVDSPLALTRMHPSTMAYKAVEQRSAVYHWTLARSCDAVIHHAKRCQCRYAVTGDVPWMTLLASPYSIARAGCLQASVGPRGRLTIRECYTPAGQVRPNRLLYCP